MKGLGGVLSALLLSGMSPVAQAATGAAALSLWQDVDPREADAGQSAETTPAPLVRLLELNVDTFRQRLAAPRSSASATRPISNLTSIELPLPGGGYRSFRLTPSGVLPPSLAEKYPDIQSYAGVATDDPALRLRLDWSPAGLRAMVTGHGEVDLIEPVKSSKKRLYKSYRRSDVARKPWQEGRHHRDPSEPGLASGAAALSTAVAGLAQGGLGIGYQRHTYRIAVSADSSYTKYHGGTVPSALAAIVEAINRVDGIYGQELSVDFVLVDDNDQLIFPDPGTDPFAKKDEDAMLDENQRVTDRIIGRARYDIGHVVSARGGGLAMLASVCDPYSKAQGMTGSEDPDGDPYWVDYVAHELGHQMGGNHTFNSPLGACNGNRDADSAYELGSGISIMGYAGICGRDNLAEHSIPYFHARSLYEIASNIETGMGSRCGVVEPTGRVPPGVSVTEQVFTIPKKTPFGLMAEGVETGNEALTYSWEEYDLARQAVTVATTRRQNPSLEDAPLFRSFPPMESPERLLPELAATRSPKPWNQREEILPAYARSLGFLLTVRDGLGGVSISPIQQIEVADNAGPFEVRFPGKNNRWVVGSTRQVRWNVAKTNLPPVSCTRVDIDLSLDGGEHFTERLASQVGNGGDQSVLVPATPSTQARVRVKCADNIFWSYSQAFTITP